ncbi:hypothetical protein [Hymenobacter cellulosilyticus]|uniref:Uncharacterized protein n=1 Tax=Hymenobacter cellulosilyticus TaxID=2932248 RepID=A0A8T9QCI5_9BACT|nr:hypothetical protein [Hymenobacter cellulosilyticus]UOQ74642.1 hypothetical protein MUN79_12685 [Hymenobacter cellulosilyticus]
MTTKSTTYIAKIRSTSPEALEMQPVLLDMLLEFEKQAGSYWDLTLSELTAYANLKNQSPAYKGRLVLATAEAMPGLAHDSKARHLLDTLLKVLLRSTLELSNAAFVRLLEQFKLGKEATPDTIIASLYTYPVTAVLTQLEKQVKKQPLDETLTTYLKELLVKIGDYTGYAPLVKVRIKVQDILAQTDREALPTVIFSGNDAFGQALNEFIEELEPLRPGLGCSCYSFGTKPAGLSPRPSLRRKPRLPLPQLARKSW